MRRLLLAALAAAFAAGAGATGIPAPVQAALDRAGVPPDAVSIVVEPVDDGPVRVAHRASAPMNPASTLKLVTTFAALELLGPAYRFRTDVLVTGTLAGGVLEGNLHVRGGGDPRLTYEEVWRMARQVRQRGVREIRGDVVLDRSWFAPAPHDPGAFDNEPRRAYNVGPDALLVNFQAVDFRFVPADGGVRVYAEPDLPNVEVASRIALKEAPCGPWRRDLRYEIEETGLIATVVFTGSYASGCGERAWPLALFDGPRFTESTLRWLWSEAGGTLRGAVREAPAPAEARLLHRHESEPLAVIVRDVNKFSNNVMARHLFLALSAERDGGGGTAQKSAAIVAGWLADRGIEAPELVLENGSGLSRVERASAATLASVLRTAWSSPVMPELLASLPVLAVDGTLKDRRARDAAGHAHLKGGTLTGVQGAAGYVLDRRGRRWIVAMLVNHPRAGAAQPAIEALVEWVHAQPVRRGGSR